MAMRCAQCRLQPWIRNQGRDEPLVDGFTSRRRRPSGMRRQGNRTERSGLVFSDRAESWERRRPRLAPSSAPTRGSETSAFVPRLPPSVDRKSAAPDTGEHRRDPSATARDARRQTPWSGVHRRDACPACLMRSCCRRSPRLAVGARGAAPDRTRPVCDA